MLQCNLSLLVYVYLKLGPNINIAQGNVFLQSRLKTSISELQYRLISYQIFEFCQSISKLNEKAIWSDYRFLSIAILTHPYFFLWSIFSCCFLSWYLLAWEHLKSIIHSNIGNKICKNIWVLFGCPYFKEYITSSMFPFLEDGDEVSLIYTRLEVIIVL